MQKILIYLTFFVVAALAGCAYKMDIQQGNVITREKLDMLKIGMSRQQAEFVMGTPLLNDPFHDNRWDYLYSFERRGKVQEQYHATLFFEGDRLVRVEKSGPIPETDRYVGEPKKDD